MICHVARSLCLTGISLAFATLAATAGERFVVVPVASLEFRGERPVSLEESVLHRLYTRFDELQPYVVLDGPGEAYLDGPGDNAWPNPPWAFHNLSLAARLEDGAPLSGRLFYLRADGKGLASYPFTTPVIADDADARAKYLAAVEHHYRRLLARQLPGAAWFRHRAGEVHTERGSAETMEESSWRQSPESEIDETYALFTGGRALSENLQLERALQPDGTGEESIDIETIAGITTRELDWKPLVKDLHPEKDPLAALVPFDQHAAFFRSFKDMLRVIDEADENGTPMLELFNSRADDAMTKERYEKQLCLPLSSFGRTLGPLVVASVAITGSDMELVEGSDVALLFECKQPELLLTWIGTRHAEAIEAGAIHVAGLSDGVAWNGVESLDRTLASYVARVGDTVVVTNSSYQLDRVLSAANGSVPSLATLDEYTFFRNRYARTDASESALIVLSDATIRRWCNPRWRIGSSRRRHAAAAMAEMQARKMDQLARGEEIPDGRAADPKLRANADFAWKSNAVISPTYGSLAFLTPIAELPLRGVTVREKAAYERFRSRYQMNWHQFFDPIAVRISVAPERLAVDLTVMPLIAGTEYRDLIDLTRGSALEAGACDPHDGALLQFALAINPESGLIKEVSGMAGSMGGEFGATPLSWIGGAAGLYVESDGLWDEWATAADTDAFMENNIHRLPIALHVAVKDSFRLAAFLTAVRGFSQQAAPNLLLWENRTHQDVTYVRIAAAGDAEMPDELSQVVIYYVALPDAFIVTLREDLLKQAIDRRRARKSAQATSAEPWSWLGESAAMHAERGLLEFLEAVGDEEFRGSWQTAAWANLPILNEWKRRYPRLDPVLLHERVWKLRLLSPGGGSYVWNEEFQTMESTVFGHPGAPKPGPAIPPVLESMRAADFGLTFENDGLRARAELTRAAK